MADCKIIKAEAKSPVTSIPTGEKTATANYKGYSTSVSADAIPSSVKEVCINNIITGFGEENVPSPELFKYQGELVKIVDTFFTKLSRSLSPDVFTLTESIDIRPNKVANEVLAIGDTVNYLVNFNRTFHEFSSYFSQDYVDGLSLTYVNRDFSLSDIVHTSFGKVLPETIAVTDIASNLFSSIKEDLGSISDILSTALGKVIVDSSQAISVFTAHLQTVKSDNFAVSDSSNTHPNKNPGNSFFTVSEDYYITYSKLVLEALIATDDVLGEANIDDDQYMSFVKISQDVLGVSETISTSTGFIREPSEPISVTDTSAITISQGLITEAHSVVDTVGFGFFIEFDESDYFADRYVANDYEGGGVVASDSITLHANPGVISPVGLSESFIWDRTHNYPEIIVTSEALSYDISKVLSDTITATDDVLGVSNDDDDQTAAVTSVRSDSTVITESLAFNPSIVRTDSATTSEVLQANTSTYFNQTYVVFDYTGSTITL